MRFAIFQSWGLGDLVMTSPVVSEFRRLHPEAHLLLVVRGKAQAALLQASPLVDQIKVMPQRHEKAMLFRFFWNLRPDRIDVAYVGTRISPILPLLLRVVSGIRIIVGDGDRCSFLYTYRNSVDPLVHRVDRMLETFSLWSRHAPRAPVFRLPVPSSADTEATRVLADRRLTPGRYVVVHAGSSRGSAREKRIPVGVVRRFVGHLRAIDPESQLVLIFGPDDVDLLAAFEPLGEGFARLSSLELGVTIAILSRARGLIGTDSALGHIAAAFDVPTITLVGPTNPDETRPYGSRSLVVKRRESLPCQPCWGTPNYGNCPNGVLCMNELPVLDIVELVKSWPVRTVSKSYDYSIEGPADSF